MRILEIPVAKELEDLSLGIRATDSGYIPGFLICPEVTNKLLDGVTIEDVARKLSPDSSPSVPDKLFECLKRLLEDQFGFDASDFFRFSAIQHRTVASQGGNSHTDSLYEGGGLWLCGETKDGEPRVLNFATVYLPIAPVHTKLEHTLPKSVECMFRGAASIGWMAYFMAKSRVGYDLYRARTAHMVEGGGIWARFGDHDEQGIGCKRAQYIREAFQR